MADVKRYLHAVEPYLISYNPGKQDIETPYRIEFLDSSAPVRANTIYLLSSNDIALLSGQSFKPGTAYFVACPDGLSQSPVPPDSNTVVFVRLPVSRLYSIVNEALAVTTSSKHIEDIFALAVDAQYPIDRLLCVLSELLDVGIFLLNPSNQMISGSFSGVLNNRYARELSGQGCLSAQSVQEIRKGLKPDSDKLAAFLYETSINRWAGFRVLLLYRSEHPIDEKLLCQRITDYIQREEQTSPVSAILVNGSLNRILEGTIKDDYFISSFFGMEETERKWFRIITLAFEPNNQKKHSFDLATRLMRSAFQNITVTVLDSQVVGIIQLDTNIQDRTVIHRSQWGSRGYAEDWEDARLERELKALNAMVCFSTPLTCLYNFHIIYDLTKSSMEVAIALDGCHNHRIVDFEEYNPYNAISFSMDSFLQRYEPRNIKALMYPEVISLLRYDYANNSNLAQLLYTYLLYGDVGETARRLYMHRNTVYNKLKTIEQILNIDVNKINISCFLEALRIFFYCDKCLGLDMRKIIMP